MQALITSYLIQKKECNLPLLGHFRIKTKPADFDKSNKQLFPPTDEILYSEFAAKLSGDLLLYIAGIQNITTTEAEEKINGWCSYAKEKIDSGEKILFDSIGTLQKDGVGNIFFQRKRSLVFYEPVVAERVLRNGDNPAMPNEIETISLATSESYQQEKVTEKEWWKIWAFVLTAISIIILVIYFYFHQFSETGIGNRAPLFSPDPPATYHTP